MTVGVGVRPSSSDLLGPVRGSDTATAGRTIGSFMHRSLLLCSLVFLGAACGSPGDAPAGSFEQGRSDGAQPQTEVRSVCARRDEALRIILENRAAAILKRCAQDGQDPCSLDRQCLKQEVRSISPGEVRFFVEASQSLTPGAVESSLQVGSLNPLITSRDEGNQRSGWSLFAGLRFSLGDPLRNTTRRVCLAPLETNEGRAFVRSLLSAVSSVTSLGGDPCGEPKLPEKLKTLSEP